MFARTLVVTKDGDTFDMAEHWSRVKKFGIRTWAQVVAFAFISAVFITAMLKGMIDLYLGWVTDDDRLVISATGCFVLALLSALVERKAARVLTYQGGDFTRKAQQAQQVQQHQQQRPPQQQNQHRGNGGQHQQRQPQQQPHHQNHQNGKPQPVRS